MGEDKDSERAPLIANSSSNTANIEDMNQNIRESEQKKNWYTLVGMICVALGTLLFCTIGAIIRGFGGSVAEIMEGDYILQTTLCALIWRIFRPRNVEKWYGHPQYTTKIWIRGLVYFIMIFCWMRGFELVPMGDADSILFLSPLLTVLIAKFYLKETLPKAFSFTFFLTLAGVFFICQPQFIFGSSDSHQISWLGLVFLLLSVITWSLDNIIIRSSPGVHWLQFKSISALQVAAIWTPLLILLNKLWLHSSLIDGLKWSFSWEIVGIMVGCSCLGIAASALNILGYQLGDVTKVAWMEYLDLVFAWLYQCLVFKETPNAWELVGVGCLLLTCFLHLGEQWYNMKYNTGIPENEGAEGEGEIDTHDSDTVTMSDTLNDETKPLMTIEKEGTNNKHSNKKTTILDLMDKMAAANNHEYTNINNRTPNIEDTVC